MGDERRLFRERSAWLRCYRCWSQSLEIQIHYDAIRRVDPETGEPAERIDEVQEAVVQCLDCMHDQPHLTFAGRPRRADRGPLGADGRRHPLGRLLHGHRRPGPGRDLLRARGRRYLTYGAFGDAGMREFFTHVRFHKHDEEQIVVHLLVELYARSARRRPRCSKTPPAATLEITSLAEESRPPAHAADEAH